MMRRLLPLLVAALAACATTQDPNKPPETEIIVLDETGEPILGEVQLWSRKIQDQCTVYDEGCGLSLPGGAYSFTFRKLRSGTFASSSGGGSGSQRGAGCLKAKITLVPGEKVVCKKTADFNCNRGAFGSLDCGKANEARYGYKPEEAEEEQTDTVPDKPAQAPAPKN